MPKKKQWIPVSVDLADSSRFQIPDKVKRPLTISRPPGPILNDADSFPVLRATTTIITVEHKPPVRSANVKDGLTVKQNSVKSPKSKIALPELSTTAKSDKHDRRCSPPAKSAQDPDLDIYARKYIPYWLRAVNESFAVPIHALPLQHLDTAQYASTFTGTDFKESLPSSTLPSQVACQLPNEALTVDSYSRYWHSRLQNELAAAAVQYSDCGLYNIDITFHNYERQLYKIHVPGVRESLPRVDLGDIILIRPLVPVLDSNIGTEAKLWSISRHGIAPGFNGQEHHAVVWSVLRRDETVIVALGHNLVLPVRCNVSFPVQQHKYHPSWQAVSIVKSRLLMPDSQSWLSRMLFPLPENGEIQRNLSSGSFSLAWYDPDLNLEQKRAVQAICENKYGEVPMLISGPAGTGKTKTIVETTLQLLKSQQDRGAHLLICAPSDSAADTLLVRLSAHLKQGSLFRLNNWTRLPLEVPGEVRPYCYIDKNQVHSIPPFDIFMAARVVVTTCRDAHILLAAGLSNQALTSMATRMLWSISKEKSDQLDLRHWTALLVDEAAQATEPEIIIPLAVVAPPTHIDATGRGPQFVLVGDEYQLGPWLSSTSKDVIIGNFKTTGLEKSLFQRLFERPLYHDHPLGRKHGLPPLTRKMLPIIRPPFANLIRNYRSHAAILATSSSLFYFDTLLPQQERLSPLIASWSAWPKSEPRTWPVMFHEHSNEDAVESVTEGDGTGAGSLTNIRETEISLEYVQNLLSHAQQYQDDLLKQEDVIVMAPFRAQVNLLRKLFRDHGLHDVRIGPLEAFQGLESRVVVLCTTRTRLGPSGALDKYVKEDRKRNLGIVDAPKLFNVSMTRAKEALIVIGNTQVLTSTNDPCWSSFLAFCARNGLFSGQKMGENVGFDASVKKSKLETALTYADLAKHKAGPEVDERMMYGLVHQDLDTQMNQLHVGEEDEERIRAEEEEDDAAEEESGAGDESEHIDSEDPQFLRVVNELLLGEDT